jgi:hypothetical protein
VAAEDVDNHVQVEIGPLGRSEQLGDVPRPDQVGPGRQQFGSVVLRVAELVAPFADLAIVIEDAGA